MRRRVFREIGTLLGVLIVLSGVVLLNYLTRQQGLKERMIAWREQIETKRESKGLELLPWKLLEKTTGNAKKGPAFDSELADRWDSKRVDLIGFMVPLETFRAMTEFILLPMPIECYFCERPPMRDVVLVLMKEGETADLYKEPILINGTLTLNKGPNTKFFYTINDTTFGPGEEEGTLTRAAPSQEAVAHAAAQQAQQEELLEGVEPPTSTVGTPDAGEAAGTQQPEPPVSGQRFLEQNATKEGVMVLPSGLQYKVIREGTGRLPGPTDKVRVHYRGTLLDGKEFDSSYARNEPAVFQVDKVIPGWTEALQLMREGAKWQLVIPPALAYGKRGAGRTIPPEAVLVFEVELLNIEG